MKKIVLLLFTFMFLYSCDKPPIDNPDKLYGKWNLSDMHYELYDDYKDDEESEFDLEDVEEQSYITLNKDSLFEEYKITKNGKEFYQREGKYTSIKRGKKNILVTYGQNDTIVYTVKLSNDSLLWTKEDYIKGEILYFYVKEE